MTPTPSTSVPHNPPASDVGTPLAGAGGLLVLAIIVFLAMGGRSR